MRKASRRQLLAHIDGLKTQVKRLEKLIPDPVVLETVVGLAGVAFRRGQYDIDLAEYIKELRLLVGDISEHKRKQE